jgi:sigma-B regulation protein RsbU (phosphoserine phosphatase)
MNYKRLFSKLEQTLDRIDRPEGGVPSLGAILRRLLDELGSQLGLLGGRIYVQDADEFVLEEEFPPDERRLGFRIPASYGPVQELLRQGWVLHRVGDPGVDREIEGLLNVRSFAAISVGEARDRIIAFSLADDSDTDHVVHTLNTIRHGINLALRKERLEDRLAEARAIQLSLLPTSPPAFHDYDLWGRSDPAEEVGGDLFDFLPVSTRSLGIAVADSAGHGLPAALQARDAIIGLRMGVEERWRLTFTIEKLNRVIARSGTNSRFISLFYGEVEPNGTLVYTNAGHNPPLLYHDGRFKALERGGLVLGPNPLATYQRGYESMEPGSVLFAYTDGVIEADAGGEEMFGVERLSRVIADGGWSNARELVDEVFAEVERFTCGRPARDDRTAVAVVRGKR